MTNEIVYQKYISHHTRKIMKQTYNFLVKEKAYTPDKAKIAILYVWNRFSHPQGELPYKGGQRNIKNIVYKIETLKPATIDKYREYTKFFDLFVLQKEDKREADKERLEIFRKKWTDTIYYSGDLDIDTIKAAAKILAPNKDIVWTSHATNRTGILRLDGVLNDIYKELVNNDVITLPEWSEVLTISNAIKRLPQVFIPNFSDTLLNETVAKLFIIDYYSNRSPIDEKTKALMTLAKFCDRISFGRYCLFLIAKPQIMKFDNNFRLHSETGPALLFSSVCQYFKDINPHFYYHGVEVTGDIILHPETITAEKILLSNNAEVARIMLDIMGMEKFVKEAKPKTIDSDTDGAGQSRELLELAFNKRDEENKIIIIKVKCPSTGREYMLRVPPTIKSCPEAVAWTFNVDTKEYNPTIES